MLLFALAAHAEPIADLCTQQALDTRAAQTNARWEDLGFLEVMGTSHTLSDKQDLTVDGVTIRVGDRIEVVGSPGTFKPYATGHEGEVQVQTQTGTVTCFTSSWHGTRVQNELAVVRWDAQSWRVLGEVQEVEHVKLGAFTDTIHPIYLTVAK